jgi:hypothetical protein
MNQELRVRNAMSKWIDRLNLGDWGITITFEDTPLGETVEHWLPTCDATTQWPYKTALIRWYMPSVKDMTKDELEKRVVHELMHIFVAEIAQSSIELSDALERERWNHEERVVSELATAVWWMTHREK